MLRKKCVKLGREWFSVGDYIQTWGGVYRIIGKCSNNNSTTKTYQIRYLFRLPSKSYVYSEVDYYMDTNLEDKSFIIRVKDINKDIKATERTGTIVKVISEEQAKSVCFGGGGSGVSMKEIDNLVKNYYHALEKKS